MDSLKRVNGVEIKMTETENNKEDEIKRPIDWVKDLLNNMVLLKWVKKFSADGVRDDNTHAENLGITCAEGSISVMDISSIKMLVTPAEFKGEVHNKLSLNQLKEIIDCVGSDGNVIITKEKESPVFIQTDNVVVVLAPKVTTGDEEEKEKEQDTETPTVETPKE